MFNLPTAGTSRQTKVRQNNSTPMHLPKLSLTDPNLTSKYSKERMVRATKSTNTRAKQRQVLNDIVMDWQKQV